MMTGWRDFLCRCFVEVVEWVAGRPTEHKQVPVRSLCIGVEAIDILWKQLSPSERVCQLMSVHFVTQETAQRGPDCSAAASVDTAHTSGSFCRSVRPSLMYWGRGPPTDSSTKPCIQAILHLSLCCTTSCFFWSEFCMQCVLHAHLVPSIVLIMLFE